MEQTQIESQQVSLKGAFSSVTVYAEAPWHKGGTSTEECM